MLTETARVVRCYGNHVQVELQRGSACDQCDLSQGCGTGALSKLLRRRSRPLEIETNLDCQPGDEVVLQLSESSLVRASLLVYGLPLLAMVVASFFAAITIESDWLVALIAIAGLFAGVKIAAMCAARLEHRAVAPYIKEVRTLSTRPARS